ncbi:hypothetical protein PILCRDRAFT_544028 [Piloderma croceum F 1598]|uniref:Uncharacterized protein n=1 Tax=Piloderma croceum (strain F 1598) TaxID=765440 RepID=A0A0C3FJM2_PILCF|nr:hypothetical protein PILCRDRAFT_544028 [Piloderma croceum F 1598]
MISISHKRYNIFPKWTHDSRRINLEEPVRSGCTPTLFSAAKVVSGIMFKRKCRIHAGSIRDQRLPAQASNYIEAFRAMIGGVAGGVSL